MPRRVYGVRRLMVLGIAPLLVVGVGRILTAGSDGSSGPDRAAQVAAQPDPTPSTGEPGQEKKRKKGKKKNRQPETETAPPTPILAQPTGPCANDDIVATPVLAEAA